MTQVPNLSTADLYDEHFHDVELVPDGAGGWLERPATVALEDN